VGAALAASCCDVAVAVSTTQRCQYRMRHQHLYDGWPTHKIRLTRRMQIKHQMATTTKLSMWQHDAGIMLSLAQKRVSLLFAVAVKCNSGIDSVLLLHV
jgi:hypothetical protein